MVLCYTAAAVLLLPSALIQVTFCTITNFVYYSVTPSLFVVYIKSIKLKKIIIFRKYFPRNI